MIDIIPGVCRGATSPCAVSIANAGHRIWDIEVRTFVSWTAGSTGGLDSLLRVAVAQDTRTLGYQATWVMCALFPAGSEHLDVLAADEIMCKAAESL